MTQILIFSAGALLVLIFGFFALVALFYKKIPQGQALIRTGLGGSAVAFDAGMYVIPVFHKLEVMDVSIKKIEIERKHQDGLICKDNLRADITVAFFVRVNKSKDDILNVAQTIGCSRASDIDTLRSLFEAKFSEALKTVGKKFEFVELYEARREFRDEILQIIGTDLNGYVLDDCAIDNLEQTDLDYMKKDNILDSEGIKKITELTAIQNIKANFIRRDEEKTIRKQDVEAREAILELERQLAEKEEKQKREIANIKSREEAEIVKVAEQERLKAQTTKIETDEKLAVQEQNKDRQIIVALKSKERAEAVETERVLKDKDLEKTERERVVALAEIEKEKVVEIERKNIQDVIRERVMLEKGVVEEKERIKDVEAIKLAERTKLVAITKAQEEAEQQLIKRSKEEEAETLAAKEKAQQMIIEADAKKEASGKEAEARKIIADAKAKEEATIGLSEAQVIQAKAEAMEREGFVEANVIEKKAEALRKQGLSEAEVLKQKAIAEAEGIREKAEAMKQLDGIGKEHEEFKLRLEKEKQIELAEINIQKEIAEAQAKVIAEALKAANIDIVGGETMFFEQIIGQITKGKGFDRLIESSDNARQIRDAILGDEDSKGNLLDRVKEFAQRYEIGSDDIKNLSIAALIGRMMNQAENSDDKNFLSNLLSLAKGMGIGNQKLSS